ncbi:MAG: T9SS C-terminal target domain-containing protein [Ignavibacteriales bacterium]|nr:MAG: T9SS C-terminal target domain-containing protein [Ignavibacteriales bacterium]
MGILVYTAIPVELVSFTADVISEGVSLKWNTASELNNRGFEVERKIISNRSSVISSWERIEFVKGRGTTSEPQSYSYTDKNVNSGIYQYRLKQIDFDGSFRIYDPVKVEYGIVKNYSLEQNYPNPFNPETLIKYTIPVSGRTVLKIYNVLGKEVGTLVNELKEAGSYEIKFNPEELSSGIYFYRLESGEYSKTRKMILLQ